MQILEIVGEPADAPVGEATSTGVGRSLPGDGWQKRADATRREQERRGKLRQRVRDAEATAHQQRRAAAERQWAANDRVRAFKRDLAAKPANT